MSINNAYTTAPLRATQTVAIAATPAQVWNAIQDFADLTWVPLVKASSATAGNSIGSVRTLDLGGALVTETLLAYDAAARSFSYAIDNTAANALVLPLRDASSVLTVAAGEDGGAAVTWDARFRPGEGRDDATAQTTFNGVIAAGLGALRSQFA